MSDYTKGTNFAVKDTLTTGDPNKIVSGAEIDTEFDNIATASGTKADKVSGATSGNVAGLDANGNLTDTGADGTEVVNVSSAISAQGDIIIGDASGDASQLTIGTSGQVLVSDGTTLSWTQVDTAGIADSAITNVKVTNGTLGSEKFQTGATEDSWVKDRVSSSTRNQVGTYAFLAFVGAGSSSGGSTESGSNLEWAGVASGGGVTSSGTPSGTWRNMGNTLNSGDAAVWVRVA